MHYEEKHIDGVLHFRTRPDGAWEKKVSKQPEALEQAEYLEKGWFDEERNRITAAAELRRLHAANVDLTAAVAALVDVIDAAGLNNLMNGVQLGQTVWYIKASDAMDFSRKSLAKHGATS